MSPEDRAPEEAGEAMERLLSALRREQQTADPGSEPPTSEEVWAFAADALLGDAAAMSERECAALWRRIIAHRSSAEELGWAVHALRDGGERSVAEDREEQDADEDDAMTSEQREATADLAIQRARERGALAGGAHPEARKGRRIRIAIMHSAAAAAVIVAFVLFFGGNAGPPWRLVDVVYDPVRTREPGQPLTAVFKVDITAPAATHVLLLLARQEGANIIVDKLFPPAFALDKWPANPLQTVVGQHQRLPPPDADPDDIRKTSTGAFALFLCSRPGNTPFAPTEMEAFESRLRLTLSKAGMGEASYQAASRELAAAGGSPTTCTWQALPRPE